MNPIQLHLLVNHLPVFAPFLALVVYVIALGMKGDRGAFLSATVLTVLGGIGAFLADQTGDGAYDGAKVLTGVVEEVLNEHAEAAEFAVAAGILGAVVMIGIFVVTRKAPKVPTWALAVGLVVSLFQASTSARVGHLGGLIRHPEIADAPAAK